MGCVAKHLAQTSSLAPKKVCTTHWSSRLDSMKPFRRNMVNILAAFVEIRDSENFDQRTRHEADCIAGKIDYTFICCVCTWYDILFQVNIASKKLQSIESNIQSAVICLKSVLEFLNEYSKSGFRKMLTEAKEIAEKIGVEDEFTEGGKRHNGVSYQMKKISKKISLNWS